MSTPAERTPRREPVPEPTYPDLPVVAHRETLLAAIRDNQVVVVAGETGSGKSTQLPKLCLELGLGLDGLIGHTQPRRLAARAISERIAEELGVEVGGVVGYAVRFNDHVSDKTCIKVMTDGILLAEIQRDRLLRAYDVLIIDEAHERSLNIDFLLGYLRQLLPQRPDLKLIITSATIDTERFSRHFGDAPVVEVSGRSFPVEVRYRPIGEGSDDRDQTQSICDAVQELAREGPGDVLVFLSGEREIRDTADALSRLNLPGTELLPLYARLSAAEQHRVFAPHQGRRVVLATNVAETSLTVPGIVAVVDPGTARISRFNRRTKVQRLPIEPISQASANQRAGRCGRVAPGTCVRLYAEDDFNARDEFTEPEILRTNLASVILQMASLGLGDVAAFPFLEPPDARSITDGVQLLEELGALDRSARAGTQVRLTKVGKRLARLPVDPRLGRMILEAEQHGCVAEVLVIAAGMSIQDPRERPRESEQAAKEMHKRFDLDDSDFLSYLHLWRYLRAQQKEKGSSAFRRMCKAEYLHHLRIREWQDLHAQLRQISRGIGLEVRPLADDPDRDGIHHSLLAGLLSHVGLWDEQRKEYRGARETRFVVAPGSALGQRRPKWVMAGELVETNRLRARVVAPIQADRLEKLASHLVTRSHREPWWDEARGAAMTEERVTLYGLPVVERRRIGYERVDAADARLMFITHALVRGEWRAPHAVLHANHERIVEVLALEHRVRRDLLVPEATLETFFDQRLPAEITTGARFDRWWKRVQSRTPRLLSFERADLIDPAAGDVSSDAFPEWVHLADVDVPLTYTDDSTSDLDGVTVDVPLLLLDHVESARLDWLVPGMQEELVTALMRTLPKEARRLVGPASDAARAVLDDVGPSSGPLLEAVGRSLSSLVGHTIRWSPTVLDALPPHLRVTYRAVDERGRALAWSKDLPALRSRMAVRIREALTAAAPLPEVAGLRGWTIEGIPRTVEAQHAGITVTGFPALVDEGKTSALRVLPTEADQRVAMWAGTRRLLLLGLGSPMRTLDGGLPNAAKLAIASSERTSAAAVYQEVVEAAVDHLLLAAGGPVWDRSSFESLLATVKDQFASTAVGAGRTVGDILMVVAGVDAQLRLLLSAAFDETVLDVRVHLDRLLHHGWISAAGVDRLVDVLRYVRAIEHRLQKAVAQPDRDRALLTAIHRLEREYAAIAARDVDGSLRWMLEELRVATFAQSLGAKGGVSEQKLRRALAAL
ncbi:MAG: ATP-dependent RNA helicase HrpA [Acidimicrobiales bacterium]